METYYGPGSLSAEEPLGQLAHALDLTHTFIRLEDGKILRWAAGAEQLYGFTRSEAIGKISHELLNTQFPLPLSEINEILRQRGEWEGELRHFHKYGRELVVASHWAIHEQLNGGERAVIEVNNDISRLKRAELEREQLIEELKRSNDELAQFAYSVSHDLQSPLRVIRGYTDLLSTRHAEELNGSAKTSLEFIATSAAQMEELIRALLDYAQAGASHHPQSVDLQDVLERVVRTLDQDIRDAAAEVRADGLPAVFGDETELLRVFQNLISNALKYRRKNVQPLITVDAERSENAWLLAVRDNGQGIDGEDLRRIFEPLKRCHGAEVAGSGMGLAICHRIIERNGGRIWAESRPGQGSSFYILWPARGVASD